MSRNFDLMQEMGTSPAFPSAPAPTAPTFDIRDDSRKNRRRHFPLKNDAALSLVQRLFLAKEQQPPHVIVFAGIDHGSGCSEMAASVAEMLAGNARGSVCLVEGNFRSPTLPALFGSTNHHGLTEALQQQTPIRSFARPVADDLMWLLSSGSLRADSVNLLSSERLVTRIAELRAEFEFVVIDAPPLTLYSDAIALGKLSDGLVLVIEAESTRREAALAAVENLRSSNIPILGAILNKRTFPIPEKLYNRL